jgi:hypothetical protein
MEKLTKQELFVLDSLTPEIGTLERISRRTGIEGMTLGNILGRMENLKLVSRIRTGEHNNQDFWLTTNDGEKYLKDNTYHNERGSMFTKEEINEVVARIVKLSDKMMDELFFRCGFIYADHRAPLKALLVEEIEAIRHDSGALRSSLLAETPMEEVLKNLKDIEEENK